MAPKNFSDLQTQELNAPLSAGVVKERKQGNTTLSYVEGWWVIRELNRIFGHDAWHQEIVEIKCVSERERKIGRDQRDGWGVSYVARISLNVMGVSREGVGAGHGIDADLGLAHESAIKEAATDALKRAAMTFGNPFGLALYDKTKANVDQTPPSEIQISDVDRLNNAFIEQLAEKIKSAGVDKNGIRTLKRILNVTDFQEIQLKIRPKVLQNLTPEYAAKLNLGQNSRGDQIIDMNVSVDAPSIADLKEAAESAFADV